ncbi:MAG: hypothetical protein JXK07_10890 [Spirochaetes bacterium]|nr:hypothetical protein [Spirochaetota bacterium]MBN2771097.1 hypothetical protein [Spirochaetota bacterium]
MRRFNLYNEEVRKKGEKNGASMSENDKKTEIKDFEKKRIEKIIKKESDEDSVEALNNLVNRFKDDTLTGR